MEITCVNCKHTWQAASGQILAARIKFGLGFVDHVMICPNCHTKNVIPATEFEASDHPSPLVPITGPDDHSDTLTHHPARADNDRDSAPTNPVPGPDRNGKQVHAVVLARGVNLLRDHHWKAETMDSLSKGQKVTILDSWSNGEETWVQLGPERWALTEQDGRPLFEILDA
jgi:hypothetical protein